MSNEEAIALINAVVVDAYYVQARRTKTSVNDLRRSVKALFKAMTGKVLTQEEFEKIG